MSPSSYAPSRHPTCPHLQLQGHAIVFPWALHPKPLICCPTLTPGSKASCHAAAAALLSYIEAGAKWQGRGQPLWPYLEQPPQKAPQTRHTLVTGRRLPLAEAGCAAVESCCVSLKLHRATERPQRSGAGSQAPGRCLATALLQTCPQPRAQRPNAAASPLSAAGWPHQSGRSSLASLCDGRARNCRLPHARPAACPPRAAGLSGKGGRVESARKQGSPRFRLGRSLLPTCATSHSRVPARHRSVSPPEAHKLAVAQRGAAVGEGAPELAVAKGNDQALWACVQPAAELCDALAHVVLGLRAAQALAPGRGAGAAGSACSGGRQGQAARRRVDPTAARGAQKRPPLKQLPESLVPSPALRDTHLVQLGRLVGSGLYHQTSSRSRMAGARLGNVRARSLVGRPTSPLVTQCSAMSPSTMTLGVPAAGPPPGGPALPLALPLLLPLAPAPVGAAEVADTRRRSATEGQEPRKVSMARVRGLTSQRGSVAPVSCCGL
jgi:hypothetical protein